MQVLAHPVTLGIACGLLFGKLAGVFGFTWLAVAEVVLRRDLLFGAGVHPPRGWQGSATRRQSSKRWAPRGR